MKVGNFIRELNFNGESVYRFSNFYFWVLKERYYRGGYRFWENEVQRGESPEAFSINNGIYSSIPLENLLVFEKASSKFFRLEDSEKVRKLKGIDKRNGTKLQVLPLSGFTDVELKDKHHIADSPVNCSQVDLTTRQQKLEVEA